MIEIRLKIPNTSIFIKGNPGKKFERFGEMFVKPDINVLFAYTKDDEAVMIPASNIAYMKDVEEA